MPEEKEYAVGVAVRFVVYVLADSPQEAEEVVENQMYITFPNCEEVDIEHCKECQSISGSQ
jgi:hypothetical protein